MYVSLAFLSYFTPSFKSPMALTYPDYTSRDDLFLLQNPIVGIYSTSLQLHFPALGYFFQTILSCLSCVFDFIAMNP